MRLKLMLRFVVVFAAVAILAGLPGDTAAKDKDKKKWKLNTIPPGARSVFGEEFFPIPNIGNRDNLKGYIESVESDVNDMLGSAPGVRPVRVDPVFGSGTDIMLIVRYEVGENKEEDPARVKLWYILNASASKPRDESLEDRNEWYMAHPDITLVSDADYYYNGGAFTILIYKVKVKDKK